MKTEKDHDPLNQHLDGLRRVQPLAPPHLASRILANLPGATVQERAILWLTDKLWRPAVAAAVPLMLGFVAGMFSSNPNVEEITDWYAAQDLVYAASIEEYDYDEL